MAGSGVDALVAMLRENRAQLEAAGIRHLMLFGSVARGEDGAGSDVDLAARFDGDRIRSLLDVARAWDVVADLLGREIDLVDLDAARPPLRTSIERDRVDVF
jgi:uncharacterized protein